MISQLSCIEFCKFQIKSRKNFRRKGSIFQTQNERLQETTTDSSNEMEMQCERKKLQDVEISIIDNSRKKILRERESLPIFSLWWWRRISAWWRDFEVRNRVGGVRALDGMGYWGRNPNQGKNPQVRMMEYTKKSN